MASMASLIFPCRYCGKKSDSLADHVDHMKCHAEMATAPVTQQPATSVPVTTPVTPPQATSVTVSSPVTPPQATSVTVTTLVTPPQATSVTTPVTPPQATSVTTPVTRPQATNRPVFNCSHCRKKFSTLTERNLHLGTHKLEKMLRCQKCGKLFSYKALYEAHMETHVGDKVYRCSKCGVIFGDLHEIKIHVMNVHLTAQPHKAPSSHIPDQVQIEATKVNLQGASSAVFAQMKQLLVKHQDQKLKVMKLAPAVPREVATVMQVEGSVSKTNIVDNAQSVVPNAPYMQQLVPKREDVTLESNKCDKVVSDEASYRSRLHHPCTTCGRLFGSQKENEIHIAAMHPSVPLVPPTGTETILYAAGSDPAQTQGQSSQDKQHRVEQVNIGTHTPSIMQPAEPINSHRLTASNLTANKHQSSALELHQHVCVLCGAEFDTWGAVSAHLQSHNVGKPRKCFFCDEQFSQEGTLKEHMMTHIREKPHKCSTCGKKFTGAGHLKTHMMIHTGEKPHKCSTCGKQFTQAGNLKTHMMTHTWEKPHRCSTCGEQFTHAIQLKTHMMTHTGVKPHKCSQCGKHFTQAGHLDVHMRTHTVKKPHKCSDCGKQYTQAGGLKYHMMTHTGENPYKCTTCGKQFIKAGTLKAHMMTHTRN